jgi:hypothetical protein
VSWPFRFTGTATIAIHFDRFAQPRPYAGGLIRLRGPERSSLTSDSRLAGGWQFEAIDLGGDGDGCPALAPVGARAPMAPLP